MAVTTKKKNLPPVVPVETDPENLHISKAEFLEKRKAQKARDAKLGKLKGDLDAEAKAERKANAAKKKTAAAAKKNKGK